jgi:hypothetical protein
MNLGLLAAAHEFVLFLDDDIMPEAGLVGAHRARLVHDAATLVADAAAAKADAAASLADLTAIAADGVLSRSEKISVRERRTNIMSEFPIWRDRAIDFGVDVSIRNNFQAAYDALIAYLAAVNIDANTNANIVRADFVAGFNNYAIWRERIIEAISQLASQRAQWASVTARPVELTDGRITTGLLANGALQSGIWGGAATIGPLQLLESGLVGKRIARDPDFSQGNPLLVYNNSGGTAVSLSRIADNTAPNGSDHIIRVSYDGIGPTSPNFGGVFLNLANAALSRAGFYARGTRLVFVIRARIPVGRQILFASNGTGDGTTERWLTAQAGTGAWATYLYERTIGTTGTFGTTGFFQIAGGANAAFTWDIALADCREIGATDLPSLDRIIDSTGNFRGDAQLITAQGTAALIAGQSPWATSSIPTARVNNLSDTGVFNSFANITNRDLSLTNNRAWTNLFRADGTTAITDAAAITSLGTAAFISGQSPWATSAIPTARVNNLNDSGVFNSLANIATRDLSQLNSRAWTNLFLANGTTAVTDAAAVTSLGTSAFVAGQSPWVTTSIPTARVNNLDNSGNLSSLANITTRNLGQLNGRAWSNLFRANGTTPITDADAITNQGTSAFVNGQGPWVTSQVPVGKLAQPRPNVFPYPFGTTDGRTPAQIGWANTSGGGGSLTSFASLPLDGIVYQYARVSGGSNFTAFPSFAMAYGASLQTSVSLSGFGNGATLAPSVDCLNAAQDTILANHPLTYNAQSDRWEVNGFTTPAGTAFLRIVTACVFPLSANFQEVVFWAIKVERGLNATPFMESSLPRTFGNLVEYNNGATVNSLRPAEALANVTEGRVAAAIANQGVGATANNLQQLDPAAKSQLDNLTGVAQMTVGFQQIITRALAPNATLPLTALLRREAGGDPGTIAARIEHRQLGQSTWSTVTTGTEQFVSSSEPGNANATGNFTNSTGALRAFEFRMTEVRTPASAGGNMDMSGTFLRG